MITAFEEDVFDCDMAICFQPSKEKEIFEVMQEAVAVRNDLFAKAMNPAEPHNTSLVRKHYAALRARWTMFSASSSRN